MGSDTSDKATADAAARAEATSTTAALGVDKKRKARRRVPRATVVTIMSAIIAFIIAQNVPELVISTIKPLPINTTRTIQTEPAPTIFYDPSNRMGTIATLRRRPHSGPRCSIAPKDR